MTHRQAFFDTVLQASAHRLHHNEISKRMWVRIHIKRGMRGEATHCVYNDKRCSICYKLTTNWNLSVMFPKFQIPHTYVHREISINLQTALISTVIILPVTIPTYVEDRCVIRLFSISPCGNNKTYTIRLPIRDWNCGMRDKLIIKMSGRIDRVQVLVTKLRTRGESGQCDLFPHGY